MRVNRDQEGPEMSDVSRPRTSPVEFITALLATLSKLPTANESEQTQSNARDKTTGQQGQLGALPETARTLMLTLHVLFPHALLDALDLLDRGLVVKLSHLSTDEHDEHDDHDDEHGEGGAADNDATERDTARWHVLSSQSLPSGPVSGNARGGRSYYSRHDRDNNASERDRERRTSWRDDDEQQHNPRYDRYRRHDADDQDIRLHEEERGGGAGYSTTQSYAVHLKAWNCSCPAFAFAAYTQFITPRSQPSTRPPADNDANSNDFSEEANTDADEKLQRLWHNLDMEPLPFGGLARSEGRLPAVCKHLLACLLAENCPAMFGGVLDSTSGPDDVTTGVSQTQRWEDRGQRSRSGPQNRKGVNVTVVRSLDEVAAWASGGVFL